MPSEVEHLMGPGEIKELERKNYIEYIGMSSNYELDSPQT